VRSIQEKKRNGECIVKGENGIHKGKWWKNPKEIDDLEDLSVDGDNIKMDLQGILEGEWFGIIWLRILASVALL
jgi:hypothetical protein